MGWFESYAWILRANPDVTLVDSSFLERAMTQSAAVLYTCHTMGKENVHTDFFAAKPAAMDHAHWGRGVHMRKVNAEASANLVFQRTIEAGRATLWYGAAGAYRGNIATPNARGRGQERHRAGQRRGPTTVNGRPATSQPLSPTRWDGTSRRNNLEVLVHTK